MPDAPLPEEVASDIADALSCGGFGADYEIEQSIDSGSRRNFVLRVSDPIGGRNLIWCRTTTRAIDAALGARFTLAREAAVLERLATLGLPVPVTLSRSGSGRTILQSYIPSSAVEPAVAISAYMVALDRVHSIDPWQVFTDPSHPTTDEGAWFAAGAAPAELSDRVAAARDLVDRLEPPVLDGADELVHGDAGRANYVVDTRREIWLVDWELVHAGSRFEDYAWCELRGLEECEGEWRREVLGRVRGKVDTYGYFRTLIYFRSMLAIASRLAAEPDQPAARYLRRRFAESEALGWRSAAALGHTSPLTEAGAEAAFGPESRPRWHAWCAWTADLHELRTRQ